MRIAFAVLLVVLAFAPAHAQSNAKKDSLDVAQAEANRLGFLLYAYDQAAWHGSDAVVPLFDNETLSDLVSGYIVEEVPEGWRVGFGRLAADSSVFLAAYESVLDTSYAVLSAVAHPQPARRSGFARDAKMAAEAASRAFTPVEDVRHNTAVLPGPGGTLYAYVLPAQPDHLVYYVGGDVRYTYDPATATIVEETPLHRTMQVFDLRENTEAITFMSAVLTQAPTETDVFYAISRPGLPDNPASRPSHYVMTSDWVYFLGPDGIGLRLSMDAWEKISRLQTGQNEGSD